MKILLLGGTVFVGRHLAEAAIARGHELTLFHRGRTGAELFPDAEHLHGDRDGGLEALGDRQWDIVIDTSGYLPRIVDASAARLVGRVGRYVFISTIAVYADFGRPGLSEDAPLATMRHPADEADHRAAYGPLKALCEQAVSARFPNASLIVRPCIIAGPHDPTDRFTYWAHQMASGRPVMAPAPPTAPMQVIDARDLADWVVRMGEAGGAGTYNAVGEPLPRAAFLEALRAGRRRSPVHWVETARLADVGFEAARFPFWTPPDRAGLQAVSPARAIAAGLKTRPLAATAEDTLAWLATQPPRALAAGLTEAEQALLASSAS